MCCNFHCRNLFFSTNIKEAILEADIIFISVNTPTKTTGIGAGRAANIKNCELCARTIAEIATSNKIVVRIFRLSIPVTNAETQFLSPSCDASDDRLRSPPCPCAPPTP